MHKYSIKHLKGFTLIELLVAISIISLIASMVFSAVRSARIKARDARRISDFHQVQIALENYYNSNNQYPPASGAMWYQYWQSLATPLASYLPVLPQDPLFNGTSDANTYYYYRCNNNQNYRILVQLETSNPVLNTDLDGVFYGVGDTRCNDAVVLGYCLGTSEYNCGF